MEKIFIVFGKSVGKIKPMQVITMPPFIRAMAESITLTYTEFLRILMQTFHILLPMFLPTDNYVKTTLSDYAIDN